MLRQALEILYIFPDQLGGAVVVIDDCENAIDDGMVRLQETDHDSEDNMRKGIGEVMGLRLEECADRSFARFAALAGSGLGSWLLS